MANADDRAKQCSECRQHYEPQWKPLVTVTIRYVCFELKAAGSKCPKCIENDFKEAFRASSGDKLIAITEGGIWVNWPWYVEAKKTTRKASNSSYVQFLRMTEVLIAARILTYETRNNWSVVLQHQEMNLRHHRETLHFARQTDAKEYARLFHPNKTREIEIVQHLA